MVWPTICRRDFRGWRLGVAVALALFAGHGRSQQLIAAEPPPALLDNMDQGPVLKLQDAGPGVRLTAQSVVPSPSRFGSGAERVVVEAPAGTSAQMAYALPATRVIDEVVLSAWVACGQPGVQLAAKVVLPRSIDPRTGEARQLLLRSERPMNAGGWNHLSLGNLPARLADQARIARATPGALVDEKEAYISHLVILVPGAPGMTELLVDQIALHGSMATPAGAAEPPNVDPGSSARKVGPMPITDADEIKPPAVPRLIQWQGEPFALLQRLGFDAVWMGRLPNNAELAEAARLNMFFVCPPPTPAVLQHEGIGPRLNRVIAWDLGQLADRSDIEPANQWALSLGQFESRPHRQTLLRPYGLALEASRIADAVVLGRPTIGSTQTWAGYAAWLSQQERRARSGTSAWVTVDTHLSSRALAQLAAIRSSAAPAVVPASFSELSLATTASFGVRPRGFFFTSQGSLAGGDAETSMRALALELTNLRLGLAEPWLAAAKTATAARSSRSDVTGLVLKVERSHLIVPLRWSVHALTEASGPPAPISFDLPGAPESSDAYLVSISGSRRLPAKRVTGGLRISVERLPDDAFLLVTEDGFAFSHVERYLRKHAPRAAQARVELAALRRQEAVRALSALNPAAIAASGATDDVKRIDHQLTSVVEAMRRQDYAAAFALAEEAETILDATLARVAEATAPQLAEGVGPVPARWSTLVDRATAMHAADTSSHPAQLLPGGEFESVDALVQAGWQHVATDYDGVRSVVRLSADGPARGSYCLDLEVRQEASGVAPPSLAAAPLWITSPPIPAQAGCLIEITGMVRLRETPLGSPDPLLLFDSVGGEESAIRITSSPSWTPFRMLRAAPAGAELRVTVALGGIGRAQVDSLAYRYIPLNWQNVAQAPRQ